MDGFIVVHTENHYLTAPWFASYERKLHQTLFGQISREIGRQVRRGNRVYYLGVTQAPAKTYEPIRRRMNSMVYVPSELECIEDQSLLAKDLILSAGLSDVSIAGVLYHECVRAVYHILRGEDHPVIDRENFEKARRRFGWSRRKLNTVLAAHVNTNIRDELTDEKFPIIDRWLEM